MENKMVAPIDNKNVMEDFIYEDFFANNYLETPANKGKTRNIIGYYNGKLLEARWSFGGNRLCLAFVSTTENNVDYMTELPKLQEYFDNLNKESDSLNVEVFNSGNWLICDFYWKNED